MVEEMEEGRVLNLVYCLSLLWYDLAGTFLSPLLIFVCLFVLKFCSPSLMVISGSKICSFHVCPLAIIVGDLYYEV